MTISITGTTIIGSVIQGDSPPEPPTGVSATSTTSSTAVVSFTAPSGGSSAISYTAVSSPGNISATVIQSGSGTITVTGLSSATSYTFTVYATNTAGDSTLSNTSNSITTLPVLGQSYAGGYFAGQISTSQNGVATHNLIVSPKSTGEYTWYPGHDGKQWSPYDTGNTGASSTIDGPTNTAYLVTRNSPAAMWCDNLSINGYSDWYLPSINELEILYYNFKYSSTVNYSGDGTNSYSVPRRTSNHTSTIPATTTVTAFQLGQPQTFDESRATQDIYLSSSFWGNDGFDYAWVLAFTSPYVDGDGKQLRLSFSSTNNSIRAIRRVPV